MMGEKYNLVILNTHPIQYFAPLYSYLNEDPELDITVLYCSDQSLRGEFDKGFNRSIKWDIDLLAGYKAIFLGDNYKKRILSGFFSLICPEVWNVIKKGGYDGLWMHGFSSYLVFIIAFFAAKTSKIPVFIRSDNHLGLERSNYRRFLRYILFKIAYKFVDGFLAVGELNRNFYLHLGVPEEKIFSVPYVVDNERFISGSHKEQINKELIRKKYGIKSDKPVILYVSKLTKNKHPDNVIKSMAELQNNGLDASILIVGSGEMDENLKDLARNLNLKNIVFTGFVNQNDLPEIYSIADIFVFPAENEAWGLVINEVMCAGLPLIVSSEVGCCPDLVKEYVNGIHINPRDIKSLTNALRLLIVNSNLRKSMGAESLNIIKKWGYKECKAGILQVLEFVKKND